MMMPDMLHTSPDPAMIVADCTMYPDNVVIDACRQVIASDAPQYQRDRAADLLVLIEGER